MEKIEIGIDDTDVIVSIKTKHPLSDKYSSVTTLTVAEVDELIEELEAAKEELSQRSMKA